MEPENAVSRVARLVHARSLPSGDGGRSEVVDMGNAVAEAEPGNRARSRSVADHRDAA